VIVKSVLLMARIIVSKVDTFDSVECVTAKDDGGFAGRLASLVVRVIASSTVGTGTIVKSVAGR